MDGECGRSCKKEKNKGTFVAGEKNWYGQGSCGMGFLAHGVKKQQQQQGGVGKINAHQELHALL